MFLRLRKFPEQTRMQKYIYGNFANFDPRASQHFMQKEQCVAKKCVFLDSALNVQLLMQKHYRARS